MVDTAELQVVQPVPQTRLGKYVLLALIGHGGMGEIFLAKRPGPAGFEKLLVIKRILPNLVRNPEFVEMFLDEARVAARLNHPNVVQVHEVGKEDGHYYMAMDYVDGQSLSRVVRESIRKNRFPQPEFFARVMSYTLEGLHHAHSLADHTGQALNIVHRDVSPQNIMITYDGGVKLLDFGIAKARTRIVQTQTGAIKGKYSYMSPEQCWGKPLDARSDVFAAGIILYEVCTGRRLFKSDSDLATMKKITEEPVPLPRSVNPHLPPTLEAVILKALEKDPDQRYQSAEAFRNDLEEFLSSRTSRLGSVELGRFMKEIFADQIATQRRSIQEVLAGTAHLDTPLVDEDESSSVRFQPDDGQTAAVGSGKRRARSSGSGQPRRRTPSVPGAPIGGGNVILDGGSTLSVAVGEQTAGRATSDRRSAGPAVALILGLLVAGGLGFYLWRTSVETGPGPTATTPSAAPKLAASAGAAGGESKAVAQLPATPAPAPSPAARPAPEAKASLEVHTDPPGAAIFVDGTDTGLRTPATVAGLAVGDRKIRLALDGYLEHGETWNARPGAERSLKITLAKKPEPAVATPRKEPTARPSKRSRAEKTVAAPVTPPPAIEKNGGTLSLDTSPWTDVYLDGKKLGRTPLIDAKLPAGTHDLRLVNEARGIREVYRVRIGAGQHVSKRLGL